MTDSRPFEERSDGIRRPVAGAGGIGAGALLVTIAQGLGANTVAGSVILYLVPVAAIFTGALLQFIETQIKYFSGQLSLRLKLWSLRRQVDAVSNSKAEKRTMHRKIDQLELDLIGEELRRLKSGRFTSTGAKKKKKQSAQDGEP